MQRDVAADACRRGERGRITVRSDPSSWDYESLRPVMPFGVECRGVLRRLSTLGNRAGRGSPTRRAEFISRLTRTRPNGLIGWA